jgi:hypothetical protein
MPYKIQEEDRQMIVLSLALCSLLRPGFLDATRRISEIFQAEEMFDNFREYNTDSVKPQ